MSRSVRTTLTASILTTSLTGAALAVPPAQAHTQARACTILAGIELVNGFILGSRSRFCNPPGEETPLTTTIQRRSGSTWITVSTGLGSADYQCVGVTTSTYRLKEFVTKQITARCS